MRKNLRFQIPCKEVRFKDQTVILKAKHFVSFFKSIFFKLHVLKLQIQTY